VTEALSLWDQPLIATARRETKSPTTCLSGRPGCETFRVNWQAEARLTTRPRRVSSLPP